MREKVSACITVGNEERNIRRCLESVRWADEIVVVDSFSSDRTPEICREYTDRVYQHRWLGYIGQKNLIKDLAIGEWILFVDGDEEVSAKLRDQILGELRCESSRDFSGYEFPRMVWYLGLWITHGDWYPDVKLRLFRKERGKCGGREPHDRMVVDGRIKRLSGPVFHYTYTDIANQLTTLNRFSSITANTQHEEGRRFRMVNLILRPMWRFFRGYMLRQGFRDGLPGLIVAITISYGVFAKYAKLWEIERKPAAVPKPANDPSPKT
jgi:glycosyltransferase involved in cell wall biosynthesis